MIRTFSRSPKVRTLLLFVLAPIAGVLLLGSMALLVVNRAVLPKVVARIENRFAESGDYELSVDSARYFPLRGAIFRGVVFRTARSDGSSGAVLPVRIEIADIQVKAPFGAVRGLDDLSDLSPPVLTPWNVTDALRSLLAAAGTAGVMPRRVIVTGATIVLPVADGSSIALTIDDLEMLYDKRDSTVSIGSAGSPDAAVTVNVEIGLEQKTLAGELVVRPLPLLVGAISSGKLGGRLSFRTVEGSQFELDGAVELLDVTLKLPAIAKEPIAGINVKYVFKATLNPHVSPAPRHRGQPVFPPTEFPKGELVFTTGDLEVNGTRMSVVPVVRGLFPNPSFELDPGSFRAILDLAETPVQQLLQSIPDAIIGKLAQTTITGTLEWDLDLRVPLDAISGMEWEAHTTLSDFVVQEIHSSIDLFKLNDEFVHTIHDESVNYHRTIEIPAARPASMEWMLLHSEHTARQIQQIRAQARSVPIERPTVIEEPAPENGSHAEPAPDPGYRYIFVDDLSPWVIRAVLTAEDGDFFFYGGVNPVTLADAIEQNIRAGEIRYGASTISMQLVKMLFLGQERLFSRKVQEMFLVYLMEQYVPVSKERILELYLNLAEFGPGVYGIYDGARYYFDKHPRDLTAGEATWLAGILPSPKTYHRYFEEGRISDGWFERMIGLYDIMLERERMTPEEYAEAIRSRPEFAQRP